MGLFDLFTKKEDVTPSVAQTPLAVVQTEPIAKEIPTQNSLAEQTALKTNAVVENSHPVMEQQTALNVNLNDVFQGGTTKEDEITQIISAQVNQTPTEGNLEQNTAIPEIAPTIPDTNPFQETPSVEPVEEIPSIPSVSETKEIPSSEIPQTQVANITPPMPDKNLSQVSIPREVVELSSNSSTNEGNETHTPEVVPTQMESIISPMPETNPFQESTPVEPVEEIPSIPSISETKEVPVQETVPTQPVNITPPMPETNPFQELTPTEAGESNTTPSNTLNEVPIEQPLEDQINLIEEPIIQEDKVLQETITPVIENVSIIEETPAIKEEPILQPIEESPLIIEPVIKEEEPQLVIVEETNEKDLQLPIEEEENSYEQVLMEQNQRIIEEEKKPTRFCEKCGEIVTGDASICPNCGEPIID